MKRTLGYLLIPVSILYYVTVFYFMVPYQKLDLQGKIDDNCCEYTFQKDFNTKLNPILNQVIETNFFKLYKVNLDSDCPFWAQTHLCKDPNTCGICPCPDDKIPKNWKQEDHQLTQSRGVIKDQGLDLFKKFTEPTPKITDWVLGKDDEVNGSYVDLTENPESYTGYQGQKIWELIYKENCFLNENLCIEERLLNRVLSGLHTSVSSHIAYKWKDFKRNEQFVNITAYYEKVGNHPDRVKNLYFGFSMLLRAFNQASDYLKTMDLNTGNFMDDQVTKEKVDVLFDTTQSCFDTPFNERELFQGSDRFSIKQQVKERFFNISQIMNCVDCQKCKTYGKMQVQGIGTALKLLFDDKFGVDSGLRRNELIALVNTMAKWSDSLLHVEQVDGLRNEHSNNMIIFSSCAYFGITIFTWIAFMSYRSLLEKFKKGMGIVKRIEKIK